MAALVYSLLLVTLQVEGFVDSVLYALAHLLPSIRLVIWILADSLHTLIEWTYPLFVLLGTLFGGAIAALRVARRARAGSRRDPLLQLRDALRAHPQLASALPWLPFAYWLYALHWELTSGSGWWWGWDTVVSAVSMVLSSVVSTWVGKLLLRALDRLPKSADPETFSSSSDETRFRAVAVTPRSQAIVAGALGLSAAMVAFVTTVNLGQIGCDSLALLVLAYTVVVGFTARWFQVASTIRVGRDGVFVQGTSKTRFYAYRDFDAVHVSGATLHLRRGTRTVVRLQLHGDDLHRGAFLAERVEAALAAARNVSGAESLVAHGRAALGADYRNASLSREQLWELIEADGTAGDARHAAAAILAVSLDAGDRSRLRIAAAHTAEPRVRVALEAFAREAEDEEESPALLALLRRCAEEH